MCVCVHASNCWAFHVSHSMLFECIEWRQNLYVKIDECIWLYTYNSRPKHTNMYTPWIRSITSLLTLDIYSNLVGFLSYFAYSGYSKNERKKKNSAWLLYSLMCGWTRNSFVIVFFFLLLFHGNITQLSMKASKKEIYPLVHLNWIFAKINLTRYETIYNFLMWIEN